MNKSMIAALACAAAFSTAALAAGPLDSSAASCYARAKDDYQQNECLQREYKAVQDEHKDVMERVIGIAKAWDKPYKSRQRWNKIIRAQQSFDAFVKRECDFVKYTTKGSNMKEKNAELACRINYLRIHINVLENHYLAAEK